MPKIVLTSKEYGDIGGRAIALLNRGTSTLLVTVKIFYEDARKQTVSSGLSCRWIAPKSALLIGSTKPPGPGMLSYKDYEIVSVSQAVTDPFPCLGTVWGSDFDLNIHVYDAGIESMFGEFMDVISKLRNDYRSEIDAAVKEHGKVSNERTYDEIGSAIMRSVPMEMAYGQVLIAAVATRLETNFRRFFNLCWSRFNVAGFTNRNHSRWGMKPEFFWNPKLVFCDKCKDKGRVSFCEGVDELLMALGFGDEIPLDTKLFIRGTMWYRNIILHQGWSWEQGEIDNANKRVSEFPGLFNADCSVGSNGESSVLRICISDNYASLVTQHFGVIHERLKRILDGMTKSSASDIQWTADEIETLMKEKS